MERIILLYVLLLNLASDFYGQDTTRMYIFKNARVVDVVKKQIYDSTDVWIRDGKIEGIRTNEKSYPDGYQVVDLSDIYLLPGMIDVHTHLASLASAAIALRSGVTTVRTAGVPAFQDVHLMQLVRDGYVAGPDVIPAGVYVTPDLGESALADPRLGPLMNGVDTEEDLREIVRINIDRGAKVIKTRGTERAGLPATDPRKQTYTAAQLFAVIEEAGRFQVPVMIHAHGDEGARAAVIAGAKSIEHGTFLSEETLSLMKEKGTFLVPTLITLFDLIEPGGDYDDPVVNMRGRYMIPKSEAVIKKAIHMGIKIATGADNNYTVESTSRVSMEVEHFRRLGMDPWQALHTTTLHAAELLGIGSETGQISTGFEADLIAIPDNPIQDAKALQDVVLVMSNGRLVVNRLPFGID